MAKEAAAPLSQDELDAIVAESDLGGRRPDGSAAHALTAIAVCWSLFQLWYASPLPFYFEFGIIGETEARAIHLSFALALAFLAYPAFASSPRDRIPLADWGLAAVAVCSVLYLVVFYRELAQRPGLPNTADITVSVVGVVALLLAARRSAGPWMPVMSIVALAYVFGGSWLPGMLAHKGASLSRAASHFWLTSEGVFGVALGVSTNFIFLFVLFGALLERAGAGNWFIQVAFALLGKFRGGPAKAAVTSSGLTGLISGSSVANVVTTGTFTIPLMKRVGYTPVKAGAIECAASVNGQIMPPVMGAAAFLMAEYVGIPYAQVCMHALLPALLTYGALFYVVDLEALKVGMTGLPGNQRRTFQQALVKGLITICAIVIFANAVYFGLGWIKDVFGDNSSPIVLTLLLAAYVYLIRLRAGHPDLAPDQLAGERVEVPDFYEVARTGLHYLIPVSVLIWCLMVERLSPGLAAFWGVLTTAGVVLTQDPLTSLFRGDWRPGEQFRRSAGELFAGLETGARNMIGVGIATATAGILVGAVTLTGIGLVMTELVEYISGGSIVIMLALVAVVCIILGTGLPTTANYVVVATLMAPVVVELAAQNDLAVPLIAVHMFVFYYGLMADVTPPVGLASYAAGAIAGADPIKVGAQGIWYEARTALLPFIFIFNPAILLIDIGSPVHLVTVVVCATIAMLAFCAALQGYFLTRNRWWETLALLLVCFTLFRPGFWMNLIESPTRDLPASELSQQIGQSTGPLKLRVLAENFDGVDEAKTIRLTLGDSGDERARLSAAGLTLASWTGEPVIASVRPSSLAARLKLRPGDRIQSIIIPNEGRPDPFWFALPAFALLGLVVMAQRARRRRETGTAPPVRATA